MRVRFTSCGVVLIASLVFTSLPTATVAALASPPTDGKDLLGQSVETAWRQCSGQWKLADGVARTTGHSPKGLIVHRAYRSAAAALTIEVSIFGSGGTILFGLDDTAEATVGHFVRIAGGTIETGWIRGASADELTGRSALPPTTEGWTMLAINTDPQAHTYDISVGGAPVVETQQLLCPGGWIGLRSTEGSTSFRNLVVHSQPNAGQASRPSSELSVHRLRYVRAGAGNVVVHDPERNLLLAMDLKGKVLNQAAPRFPVRATTEVTAGGKTYIISNGRLIVSREGEARSDTVRGPIVHAVALVRDRDGSVYVTDSGSPAVHQVGGTGAVVRTWRAKLLGGFIAPHGIDLLGTKELVVADYDRVVILTKGRSEDNGEITSSSRSIIVEWALPSSVTPFAEVSEDGSSWRRVTGDGGIASAEGKTAAGEGKDGPGAGKARVVIGNLEPSTSYLVRFGPVVKTIPASAGISRVFEASTLSGDPSSAEAR